MVPLNAAGSFGRRTMMRVVYAAPFAVPETKYSSVRYGKSSTFTAVGTTLIGGFGYINPGPAMGPVIAGTAGASAAGRAIVNAASNPPTNIDRIVMPSP